MQILKKYDKEYRAYTYVYCWIKSIEKIIFCGLREIMWRSSVTEHSIN